MLITTSSPKLQKGNVSAGFTIPGSLSELQRELHQQDVTNNTSNNTTHRVQLCSSDAMDLYS
jgi:hypothetical protein